jgi:hypothetical protein
LQEDDVAMLLLNPKLHINPNDQLPRNYEFDWLLVCSLIIVTVPLVANQLKHFVAFA